MSEQVNLLRTYNQWRRSEIEGSMDELGLHPTDIGKAIDAVLDDYATLKAECASLKNSLLAITTRHFAERWKQTSKDSELEQYLSAGIAQLEEERDAALAECERLSAELAALKAQEPVLVGEVIFYSSEHAAFTAPFRTVKWVDGRLPDNGVKLYTIPTINQQLAVK